MELRGVQKNHSGETTSWANCFLTEAAVLLGVAATEMKDANHGDLGNLVAVARKEQAAAAQDRKTQVAPTQTRPTALRARSVRC